MSNYLYMPTRVIIEKDCVKNRMNGVAALGSRCLIVTGKCSAKKSGALDDVTGALDALQIRYEIFDGISQNPSADSCRKAGQIASDFGANFIIGIGGGSPLDAAKAAAVFAANPGMDISALYSLNWAKSPLPVVAVGTTAGTGSEVTPVSVLTNPAGLKKSIRDDRIYPVLALGDAKYTASLSDEFTRSTAADAMAHCVESYFNRAANDISRLYALKGVSLLLDSFKKLSEFGSDALTLKDRGNLYTASVFGGLAISITGTAFPHALGYFLSERYSIAHGTACAVYLPEFISYNKKAAPEAAAVFFDKTNSTQEEFCSLMLRITPQIEVHIDEAERRELFPRWVNNKSLGKCLGEVTPEFTDSLINRMFGN